MLTPARLRRDAEVAADETETARQERNRIWPGPIFALSQIYFGAMRTLRACRRWKWMSESRMECPIAALRAVAVVLAALTLPHLLASPAVAQQTRELPMSAASTAVPVPLLAGIGEGRIQIDAVVSDASGKSISGLREQEFRLVDDGAPGKILSFHGWDGVAAKVDPPVELVLVIDAVNSGSADAAGAEREAQKFLRWNDGHLAQPTSVYRLSQKGLYGNPQPSQDGNALAESLEHPKELPAVWRADGSSDFNSLGLLDYQVGLSSGYLSRRAIEVLAIEERRKPGRKLVVWLGSGWPAPENGGDLTRSVAERWIVELSTRLREGRAVLYRLATPEGEARLRKANDEAQFRPGILSQSLTLEALALQSGGRSLDASDDLAERIRRCLEDAPVFYTLTFDPPRTASADEYHDLKLETADSKLTVRTRSGYYDEPGFYDEPDAGVKPVTVAQLEAILAKAPSRNDKELARMLAGVEVTERLSNAKFAAWKARLPGEKSRSALMALADAAAFLDLPAEENPDLPIPDLAAQRQMMARTIDYLKETIPKLPNFYAKRTTVRYEEPQSAVYGSRGAQDAPQPLLRKDAITETVLYRGGHETVEESKSRSRPGAVDHGLQTLGTFGPILGIVVVDMAHGSVGWSRWERGDHGPVAVFRYTVPAPESHYGVSHCCVPAGDGTAPVQGFPGYHGKISIDPAQGTILRLTVEADLAPRQPPPLSIDRSDILVEYGEVAIGGSNYTCPVRSVSISRARTLRVFQEWGVELPAYGPFATLMGDTSFNDYHMFRSESRLILDPEAAP